jgi:hypothetical protein
MNMKIQVSKVFASFINKAAKELGFECEAQVVNLSPTQYQWLVGDTYEGETDYNWQTGKFKAIKVLYPYEYYANPVFLSTARIVCECRRRGVDSEQGLKEMLKDLLEV